MIIPYKTLLTKNVGVVHKINKMFILLIHYFIYD
jgi:hypothetical protein